ncbi:MAG: YgeY family selenium metabolism-linked hydrolase [Fusobacterium perfoetens]|uniref:YgeY family selenium metabolism-linked hydrolase n=1 Tax=Fusobacterium perfoetens TaxID=852 RepID=UPI0023F157F5|nr:YgeY family selenium metabolism-linked hydrolase [Fusobacterium perfoetens]MCI6152616.1 YgeY family selenium metabolism-linked hydrolase [Fusobacterium perfoetens]MDY3237623.1 YgeY family selenium metabolism-linked hydrolase [Fusobacterium perfoetens]
MLTEERKEEVVKVLQKAIQIKSYSGEEGEFAKYLEKLFLELGYDKVHVDEYGNVIASVKGKYEGPRILCEGHMDTVPVNESQWTKEPFGGEVSDGKLYGRGSTDMKSALCLMALAGGYLAKDLNKEFAGELFVAGSVHEECFEGVAARSISKYAKPDYVIIGEPSQLHLKVGQKGRGEIVVETFGKPAHSSNPQEGINSVYKMMKLIEEIRKIPFSHHKILGDGVLELTDIKSSPYPGASVVPDYCMATYDRRLLVGETMEDVLKPIQDIIDKLTKEDNEFKARVSYSDGKDKCWTGNDIVCKRFFPGWIYDEKEEYIQKAKTALKEIGQEPPVSCWYFCTNASHYAGELGIKTIGYGPSKESLAHTIDEYIELEQAYKGIEGYYAILKAYLK